MTKMNKDIAEKLAGLPAEKRLLLFQKLEEQSRKMQSTGASVITRRERKTNTCPLSFAQQRLWFIDQLEPGNPAYNMFYMARLRGRLDVDALAQGFKQVVQRHESLRTTFQAVDGQPYQVIAPSIEVGLQVVNLMTLPPAEQEAEVQRVARREAGRPFDLARGPLVRCDLLPLSDSPATGVDEHILLLTMHHIISDGWSMGVLFREIILLGQAFATGLLSPLPELPLQYPDFALWQRDWLQGDVLETQLGYWKKQLAGAPAALELPTDRPRPALQTHHGARLHVALSPELNAGLQALSRQENATLFMTLLAAFQALLSRYSGHSDIVVGSPVANRRRSELEGLIGFFVNDLVLRTDLSGNPSFRELLGRVREVCLGAYQHQDVPFEKLVDEIQVRRDLSRNPLFQVMFILQNAPLAIPNLSGLSVEALDVAPDTAQFDLRLSLQEKPEGLGGILEYNTDLFDHETAVLLVDLYRHMLESWVRDPDLALAEIGLPKELTARVETARARDRRQTIAVAASFTAEPLEQALAFWAQELGLPAEVVFAPYNQIFQQLLDPASSFSQNEYGVNLVLVRFEDWLRDAGSADPSELLRRNLADLQSALSGAAQRSKVPCLVLSCPASPAEAGRSDLYLSMEEQLGNALATHTNLLFVPSTELAAYYPVQDYYDAQTDELGHVPYTPAMYAALATLVARKMHVLCSAPYKVIVLDCDQTLWQGVCGEDGPLGVQVDAPHQALQEFMARQQKTGKLLCLCSKNEESDVWDVFSQRADMPLKRDQIVAWRINWQPKSENLRALAEELNLGLESFIFVDDNPLECAEVRANCPQVFVLELPAERQRIAQTLLHQWAFDQLQVTSEDERRTQMYQENLSRQRLQAESLTFEKFISQLELQIDILELHPSLVSRASQLTQRTNQFNTTTLRRSEAEVQALGPQHCRVVDVRDRFGAYGLVGAMFYKAEGSALQVDSLLLSCRALGRGVEERMLSWLGGEARSRGLDRVDVHYIPSKKNRPVLDFLEKAGKAYEECEGSASVFRFPLEALEGLEDVLLAIPAPVDATESRVKETTGPAQAATLNRIGHDLWQPEQVLKTMQARNPAQQRKGAGQYEAPRTPAEEALADIWRQVLNLERVGVYDNFFDLGGDSLQVMRIVARAHRAGLHFTPQDFFQRQTIAELAAWGAATVVQAEPEKIVGLLPLTVTQKKFLGQESLFLDHWNLSRLIEVPAGISPQMIEQVLRHLWVYHDALRTRFVHTEAGWRQIIASPDENTAMPFSYFDFSNLPAREQTDAIERTADELQRSLNISEGPLMRVALFNLGAEKPGRLFFIMHHLIYDGASAVFFDDFALTFQKISLGEPVQLPAKTTPLWQWLQRLEAYTQSHELHREFDYWFALPWGELRPLPLDYPENREKNTWGSAHSVPARLSLEETETLLREIPKAYGVQIVDVLITALVAAISNWSNERWSMISAIDFGRNVIPNAADIDLSRTVGWFAISRQLVLQRDDHPQPKELLKSIRAQLQSMPNRGLGHELLIYGSQDKEAVEKLRSFPKSEISFNYLGRRATRVKLKDAYEYPGPACDPRNLRPEVLECDVSVLDGRLVSSWRYSKNLHKQATIKTVAENYIQWLQALIAQYASDR